MAYSGFCYWLSDLMVSMFAYFLSRGGLFGYTIIDSYGKRRECSEQSPSDSIYNELALCFLAGGSAFCFGRRKSFYLHGIYSGLHGIWRSLFTLLMLQTWSICKCVVSYKYIFWILSFDPALYCFTMERYTIFDHNACIFHFSVEQILGWKIGDFRMAGYDYILFSGVSLFVCT